jgi:ATP-dependent DNA ligase
MLPRPAPSLAFFGQLVDFNNIAGIGSGWAYEIKHDGFRFLAVRRGKRVRVFSHNVALRSRLGVGAT